MRQSGRHNSQMRSWRITPDFTKFAAGSVLAECGDTKVICTASVEERVPPFMADSGRGWITAEYSMLPGATAERNQRDISRLKLSPRSSEIQRLIGRSLRAAVDLEALGERTITVDCDVIQADGGTRCTSITGGCAALNIALERLVKQGILKRNPMKYRVGAVSVGKVDGELVLDLDYSEDSRAGVDMNIVMTEKGGLVEVQGTGEKDILEVKELTQMLEMAMKASSELFRAQNEAFMEALI